MSNLAVHFSSKKQDWETPQDLFDKLENEFGFDLDVCATSNNAKCNQYIDKYGDGLMTPWMGTCWMNPPYGREIIHWVKKAHEEAKRGVITVALLPARTDTRWFHNYIYGKHEIRFIKGRLKFKGAKNSAPFPSMIVVFNAKFD